MRAVARLHALLVGIGRNANPRQRNKPAEMKKIMPGKVMPGKALTAIGLMSGTSMDGIDCALIRSDGEDLVEQAGFAGFAYEAAFKRRIEAVLEEAKSLDSADARNETLSALEAEITRRHGEAVAAFLAQQQLSAEEIALIGFHGQTVLHRPEAGFTVQLGDGAKLAAMTGIATGFDPSPPRTTVLA